MKKQPLHFSLVDWQKSASRPGWLVTLPKCLLLAALLGSNVNGYAAWSGVRFSAEHIEFDGSALYSVTGRLDAGGNVQASAETATFEMSPGRMRSLSLSCPASPSFDGGLCSGGEFRFELPGLHQDHEFSEVSGLIDRLVSDPGMVRLQGRLATEGLEAGFHAEIEDQNLRVDLSLAEQSLMPLQKLQQAPAETQWIKNGTGQGEFQLTVTGSSEPVINYRLQLTELSFDSPEGLYAGEGLQLDSQGMFSLGGTVSGRLSGSVTGGELLLGDFYRDFSDAAMAFEAQPTLNQAVLRIEKVLLTDHSAFKLQGSAQLGFEESKVPTSFTISNLELEFPGAYKRYFESVAAIFTLDGLELTGSVRWSGDWQDGAFQSGELELKDMTIVDIERGRFAITGLDARMRPGDHEFDSSLTWLGLLVGPVNLGAAELRLDSAPGRIALTRALELDVLGGQLVFDSLAIELPGSIESIEKDLDIELRAEMRSMDMELLTKAMDWPGFTGEISGVIPAVSLNEGVLTVDGEILFEVFDGRIALTHLRVERPFGVLPSLAANIDIHDLDLEKVTRTFSFGQIGGRLDGYVHDLRMLDWKPVAFDAWLGTPARQEKSNDISRQAVNHLTTLGGGAATTALTGPIMKMFNSFSYRRLGLGCRLQNNVCDLRGISEDETSVLIMEGAGIPKIMIKAFNRSLDFPQLLAGLTAVSGDQKIRVGD